MNRKQRKIKRQRANQHRIASLKKLRQSTSRVRVHWLRTHGWRVKTVPIVGATYKGYRLAGVGV